MLSARGVKNACPRCQFTLGLLAQISRPARRLNSQHATTSARGHLAQHSVRPAIRAFSTSRRWRTEKEPAEDVEVSKAEMEQFVRDTKQRFRDTLPREYLNEEEYALYLRLYGPPLRETEPDDVGIPSHADMGTEPPKPVNEGTIIKELESGEFEEITYDLPPEEVQQSEEQIFEEAVLEEDEEVLAEEVEGITPEEAEEIAAREADEAFEVFKYKDPDYVDTVARNQREYDAMKKLQQDFQTSREKQQGEDKVAEAEAQDAEEEAALETYWPPERQIERRPMEDEDDMVGERKRFHPLTLEGRFHDSPVEISIPREEMINPVREMLERTHIRHVRAAAEEAFGGRGLPTSPVTLPGQRSGKQEAVGLPPGQRHMTKVEGDAFLAGYLPPVYASSMAVLREVRKRLGGDWLQSMLKRTDGSGPRILDAGAGGGGLIAWDEIVQAEWDILKENGEVSGEPPGKKTVLAASDRLRDRLKNLLNNTTFLPRLPDYQHSGDLDGQHLEAGSKPQPRKSYDIVLASHLLMAEKWDHHRQAVLNNLWSLTNPNGGVLIFVEKAHPRGFEAVAHVRETILRRFLVPQEGQPTEEVDDFNPVFHRVLEEGHIIAPCTTHSKCPMYLRPGKSEGRRDFCHFSQRFVAPTFYSRMTAGGSQGEVEFSYVAFQRGVPKQSLLPQREATEHAMKGYEQSSSKPNMQQLPRMILPPLKRTGHVTLDVCTPEGKAERWTVPKSFSKLAYHDARKARWGDLWALGAKTRVERKVRAGRGKDDGGLRAGRDGKGPRRVTITVEGDNVSASEANAGRKRRENKKRSKSDELIRELEQDDAALDREIDEEMEAHWRQMEAQDRSARRRKAFQDDQDL
ncbi:mitochondrial small ribosomal subunit rsm22 domain-containing protein [Sarocladium implicatum]|nr:mitochondrial small ribosomal subunit rsm22 domain-containing protein [Sarocladium implicatum]